MDKSCQVCGSTNYVSLKYGLHCLKHFRQIRKYGLVIHGRTDPNIFTDTGDFFLITIFDRYNKPNGTSKIDRKDVERVKKYRWCFDSNGYVQNKKAGRLHNFITGRKGIDHINRDKSDNRNSNLRQVSQKINVRNTGISSMNTSGYKGVSPRRGKWRASIVIGAKQIHLGDFPSKEDAFHARIRAENKYWKEEI